MIRKATEVRSDISICIATKLISVLVSAFGNASISMLVKERHIARCLWSARTVKFRKILRAHPRGSPNPWGHRIFLGGPRQTSMPAQASGGGGSGLLSKSKRRFP
jgi:hypothetical protein